MTFLKELEIKKQLIEEYMKNDLANEDFSYKTVISAMKYSLQAGGKRIRPILMMSVYELFGKDSNEILPFAAAIASFLASMPAEISCRRSARRTERGSAAVREGSE